MGLRIDGLGSGLDTTSIINSILEVQKVPVQRLEARIELETTKKTAFLSISALLLGTKTSAGTLAQPKAFEALSINSSIPTVLTAKTDSTFTQPGNYQFQVKRLATSDQYVSQGFASPLSTLNAGTLSLEVGNGSLKKETELSALNGGQGVSLGQIKITDKSGASSIVDLSSAVTAQDVINSINSASGANVNAKINASGQGIEVEDLSGGGGSLNIDNIAGSLTATQLGLKGSSAAGQLGSNADLLYMNANTKLDTLNDGLGIRTGSGDDFNITLSDGSTTVGVNLSSAQTVQDVLDAINATHPSISASIAPGGNGLAISDNLGGPSNLTVTANPLSNAAFDLGIESSVASSSAPGALTGRHALGGLNTVLLHNLNGGNGVAQGSIQITDKAGNSALIDLSGAQTLHDVIETINGNGTALVQAEINSAGHGISIRDLSGASGGLLTIAEAGSSTAADLGIENGAGSASSLVNGSNLQLKYISEKTRTETLNGGKGVFAGSIKITDRLGNSYTISLAEESNKVLSGIIDDINGATGGNVTARVNDTGDGLLLVDNTGGTGNFRVEEVNGGSTAKDLRLLQDVAADQIDGSFEYRVTIDAGDSLQTIVGKINSSGAPVTASLINDGTPGSPYRLNITSKNSGSQAKLVLDGGGVGLGFSQTAQGQDALLLYGSSTPGNSPLLIRSNTNEVKNVVQGLTLNLLSASSAPVTVSATQNTDGIVDQIKKFVDSVNTTLDKINELTRFDPDNPEQAGLLFADSSMRSIKDSILRKITSIVPGLSGNINLMSQVGIRVTQNGKLSFDENTFRSKLSSDFEGVKEFFTKRESVTENDANGQPQTTIKKIGFAATFDVFLDRMTNGFDGTLITKAQGFDKTIENYNQTIEQKNKQIASLEGRLIRQFANLEAIMAQSQATMQRLEQQLVPIKSDK